MAEKTAFVQIVDINSGKIERIVTQAEIEALPAEEKLALSRTKNLYIVTHTLEPIVKVEMKKSLITEPMYYAQESTVEPEEEAPPKVEPETPKRGKKKS